MDRDLMEEKLNRLEKHLRPPFVVDVSLERHQHHGEGVTIQCIIRVEQGKKMFHADRSDESLQTALDMTMDAMQRELAKEHDRQKRHGGGVQR